MSRILITGGAGFIGSHLAIRLSEVGHIVTVIDSLSSQIHSEVPEQSTLYKSIADKVRFIRGDVCKLDDMASALEGQNVVVHLAAETGTGQSMYEIDRYSRVNVGGTALLLDILANTKTDVKRVVVASSRAVYGEGKYLSKEFGAVYPKHRSAEDMAAGDFSVKYPGCVAPLQLTGTDEQSKMHPSSVYGITKQAQEQLVMTVCASIKLEPVALRYQNVYGPGQSLSNPYTGILSIFSGLILAGRPVNVFEDGTESRDFVFIDDVVDATILAIEKDAAAGEVFNVGTGKSISILKVAELLLKSCGGNSRIEITGNFRIGDIRHNYADISKISRLLGFSPSSSFEQGLSLFWRWVRAVGAPGSSYRQYQNSLKEMGSRGLLQ
jgi:dTDP-L-rhamnose 4-epimerase